MKRTMKTIALVAVLALAAVAPAAENKRGTPPEPRSSPTPSPNGASWERAAPPAISAAAPLRAVAARVSPAEGKSHVATELAGLQGARAVALKEGEATLLVDGSVLSLRPGSLVGSDVVKSIGGDRVILVRGPGVADPAGAATVVVSFDGQGRARVRVYWLSDPAATVPREVR